MKSIVLFLMIILFSVIAEAAGSFTVNGDGTITISFVYTGPTATVQKDLGDAVTWLWFHNNSVYRLGYSDFTLLTNQQKLNIIDLFLKNSILELDAKYKNYTDTVQSILDTQSTYTIN